MKQLNHVWVTGIATAAVLIGSVGAALAGVSPTPSDGKKPARATAPVAASASASVKTVSAWQQFRIRGAVKHMPPGTRITLQQKRGKSWLTLPASMNTTRKSTYNMRVVLGFKGHNKLRLVAGRHVVSPVISVRVL